MGSFKEFRKKYNLKNFHKKVDEIEEQIGKKLKECWVSMVQTISTKFEKKSVTEIEDDQEEPIKPKELKSKKKVQSTEKIKQKTPPKINKSAPKLVNENKKVVGKTSTKPLKKSISIPPAKLKQSIPPKNTNSVLKEKDEVVISKPSLSKNSSSISSKKRGRPKKNEGFSISKTPPAPSELSSKSKNSKKVRSK